MSILSSSIDRSHPKHCLPTHSSSHHQASSSFSNLKILSTDDEKWPMVERTAYDILSAIRPNVMSEERRMTVIRFIQTMFKRDIGTKVYPLGSVPLRTFLPDGDIDLTAISPQNFEDAIAFKIYNLLKAHELDRRGFLVTDVNMIYAQVKLVKCMVNNIPVDITFNKVGGLCTLCFLEKVDLHIGKNHLFKRSVILIKSWCFYESRTLGAANGLVSTYALEALILHVINMYPNCLCGPLAVLYKFLEYYSAFQWDKYGVSVTGLIVLGALPKVVVQRPVNEADMIVDEDFMVSCIRYFSVPIKAVEAEGDRFQLVAMNILDPLNPSNNLGRSISRGNLHRIRLAFSYGYRKLRETLALDQDGMYGGLRKFFTNTLCCQQQGRRNENCSAMYRSRRYTFSDLNGSCMSSFRGMIYGQSCLNYTLPFPIRGYTSEEDIASLDESEDEDEAANSTCLNFSIEDFPLLPTTKKDAPSQKPLKGVLLSSSSKSDVSAVSDNGFSPQYGGKMRWVKPRVMLLMQRLN